MEDGKTENTEDLYTKMCFSADLFLRGSVAHNYESYGPGKLEGEGVDCRSSSGKEELACPGFRETVRPKPRRCWGGPFTFVIAVFREFIPPGAIAGLEGDIAKGIYL